MARNQGQTGLSFYGIPQHHILITSTLHPVAHRHADKQCPDKDRLQGTVTTCPVAPGTSILPFPHPSDLSGAPSSPYSIQVPWQCCHTSKIQLNEHISSQFSHNTLTGSEDNNEVIITNTTQKSVTLGLLKLALNKPVHSHSTTHSPSLSSLEHQHCLSTPVLPADQAPRPQSSAVTWLLSENSAAQAAHAIEQTFTSLC